jgi:DNA-binding transcriptional LysR family regulator
MNANFDERILNGMGVLAAVVRSGTFAAAARDLGISQPGVSRSIARLEARLGVRLIERTTRSIALTEEGRRLHAQIVPLLAGLEQAATAAASGKAVVSGTLRVNVDTFCSHLLLGPRLRDFLKAHPHLRLELLSSVRPPDVVAEAFDLSIRFGEPRGQSLVARKLLETPVVTVASSAYLRRHGVPEHPRDLREGKHTLIDFQDPVANRPYEWVFLRGRREESVATDGTVVLNDAPAMLAACLAGIGIAQMLAPAAEPLIAGGRLVRVLPDWADERFPLFAYYPSREFLPTKTRAFLDFVVALLTPSS